MLSSLAIADKAALQLQDKERERFVVPDVAKAINGACRELVRLKPTALTASVAMLLAAGSKQSLAGASFKKTADGTAATLSALQLLEPLRNLGTTGTEAAAGNAVTVIERQVLDRLLPGWHMAARGDEVWYVLFDPKDPKTFWVYPQAPGVYLEVLLARLPVNTLADDAVVLGSNDLDAGLDDIYEEVLADGALALLWGADSESPASLQRAAWYLQKFQAALGVKFRNEVGLAPERPGSRQALAPAMAPVEGGQ